MFVTDIFEKNSYCIYNTNAEEIIKMSYKLDKIYEGVLLEGVLSRKVQMVPYIMEALDR